MKTIGIVGSRRRTDVKDFQKIELKLLEIYEEGDRIVSGGCPTGADSFAETLAKKWQIPILIHYARWNVYGKGAGHKRNTDIAEDCNVLISTPAPDRTGGTEDTIKKVQKMSKDLYLL
jgi:hypothetical protein